MSALGMKLLPAEFDKQFPGSVMVDLNKAAFILFFLIFFYSDYYCFLSHLTMRIPGHMDLSTDSQVGGLGKR
jgi:hypothetical protein